MVWVPALRCGQPAVLAENGVELDSLRSKSLALIRFRLCSSAQPDGRVTKPNARDKNQECMKREALHARESQQTVMFARERSTRGHMKSPPSPSGAREGLGEGVGSQTYCPKRAGVAA
jgi:hypothetical protein